MAKVKMDYNCASISQKSLKKLNMVCTPCENSLDVFFVVLQKQSFGQTRAKSP